MKQQEVFKKIGVIIKELNEQYEYLKTVEGPLNELELELFLANSHFLGDHVTILGKLNSQNTADKKPAEKPVEKKGPESHELTFFEPLVQAPSRFKAPVKPKPVVEEAPVPQIEAEQPDSGDSFTFVKEEEPETIRHELILDEADWEEDEEIADAAGPDTGTDEEIEIPPVPEVRPFEKEIHFTPVSEVKVEEIEAEAEAEEIPHEPELIVDKEPKPEPVQEEQVEVKEKVIEPKPEPVIIAEEEKLEVIYVPPPKPAKPVVKKEVLTINDRMSAKMGENKGMAEQLHEESISDLKKAITLNDKLLYIKDLFNGYSLAYSEAIEILNRFTGLEEADLFLKKNYAVKNHWEEKPHTTEQFYAILKRRYA